jgi:hypothetical protein
MTEPWFVAHLRGGRIRASAPLGAQFPVTTDGRGWAVGRPVRSRSARAAQAAPEKPAGGRRLFWTRDPQKSVPTFPRGCLCQCPGRTTPLRLRLRLVSTSQDFPRGQ